MKAIHGHRDRATEILAAVADRFGIQFTETQTGGGCMALEAPLESGHWIVAVDDGLMMSFVRRIEAESHDDNYNAFDGDDACAMGWSVGIYPDNDGTWMSGEDSIVDVVDYDAYAEALPDMVARALDMLVSAKCGR